METFAHYKVLIIDQDRNTLEKVQLQLDKEWFSLQSAKTGSEGYYFSSNRSPTLF